VLRVPTGPHRLTARLPRLVSTLLIVTAILVAAIGCSPAEEPVRDAREALGTIVTITAYGEDTPAVEAAIEEAYEAMATVERELNVYPAADGLAPACGSAAALNQMPYEWSPLPIEATEVLDRVAALDVTEEFSVALLGVQDLYDFEDEGRVPETAELIAALGEASTFEIREGDVLSDARFLPIDTGMDAIAQNATGVGVDFGGAAKGLGLDRAAAALRESGAVDAAVISAGSTTIAVGEKPGEEPWRIGIEDPRDPENVISVVEVMGGTTVSTSGDYQRYFEADGVRYHHILDPETGQPARGLRSLTVGGATSGLDSDILSTALFVMGADDAATYAEREGLGLFVVDDEGRTLVTPGPKDSYSFIDPE